jgi:hypothetical protein
VTGFQRRLVNSALVDFELVVPVAAVFWIFRGITERLPIEYRARFSEVIRIC